MIRFDERNKRWRWEFDRYVNGERVRKSRLLPVGSTEEQAAALAATWEAREFVTRHIVAKTENWDDYVESLLADRKSWLYTTATGCRGRSAAKDRECGITAAHIAQIMRRSGGRCEVTGIAFQTHKPEDSRARPFFHSLDRIDSSKGYVPGNCRIVCYAVNLAMSNWGEEVFAQIATGYIVNRYCALGLTAHGLGAAEISAPKSRTT